MPIMLKPIEIGVPRIPWPFPSWVKAVTIWPFIFYKTGLGNYDLCTHAHELYHWREQMRWFVIPWFVAYLLLGLFYLRQPADRHPMERKAYRLERECRRKGGK